jgi:transposase-like protein
MTTTDTATTTETTATRATWKQHGRPTGGFEFFGTEVKTPATKAVKVGKVVTGPNGITLKGANGREIRDATFAAATKFWAIVPADAPRQVDEPKPPKAESTPAAPIEITAPKGGTQTVPPIKDAIAKAVKESGSNIMAISRAHGLNPAQMRRLALNQVAKVDLVRAEAIAKALGVKLADLFGEPTAKAKAAPKGNGSPATDELVKQAEAAAAEAAAQADKAADQIVAAVAEATGEPALADAGQAAE